MPSPPETDLTFPVECNFRIIAEDLKNMHFVVETVLISLGVHEPLEQGNSSAGGTYISLNVTTTVASREALTLIDTELRSIQGVRMVM